MKLSKKITLGVAVSALLVGGLAGCGNQSADNHSQQKAQTASQNQGNSLQQRQKRNQESNQTIDDASDAFKQTSPLEKKYENDMTTVPGNVTVHGKTYASLTFDLFKLPKSAKGQSYRINQNGISNNVKSDNPKDYAYNLPYKDVMKAFWKDVYHGVQKKGLQNRTPGVYVFRYINGNPDNADTSQSAIYYGMTNSPKLHVAGKNQFKSEGMGSY